MANQSNLCPVTFYVNDEAREELEDQGFTYREEDDDLLSVTTDIEWGMVMSLGADELLQAIGIDPSMLVYISV